MLKRFKINKFITYRWLIFLLAFLFYIRFAHPASAFQFVAWGDTKSDTGVLTALSKQAKTLNPDFTLYAGDLESSGFTTAGMNTWKNAINGSVNNGLFDITFPVRGNHDSSNTADWQTYFDLAITAANISATNYTALNTDTTYSFDFGNSRIIGLDVLGDVSSLPQAQITWIDQRLADAQSKGLTHAFIFFHGPIYCVAEHCSCSTITGCVPTQAINLINVMDKYPIVSATFHGHEHVFTYTHINKTRIPAADREFEQFVVGDAGAGPDDPFAGRVDYAMDTSGNTGGFVLVDVNGPSYTVSFYKGKTTAPQKIFTFTKGPGGPTPTPSPSPSTTPPTIKQLVSNYLTSVLDQNGDGKVNLRDIAVFFI